jgi:hypothetical protein
MADIRMHQWPVTGKRGNEPSLKTRAGCVQRVMVHLGEAESCVASVEALGRGQT